MPPKSNNTFGYRGWYLRGLIVPVDLSGRFDNLGQKAAELSVWTALLAMIKKKIIALGKLVPKGLENRR